MIFKNIRSINFKSLFKTLGFLKKRKYPYLILVIAISLIELGFTSIQGFALKWITEACMAKDLKRLYSIIITIIIIFSAFSILYPILIYSMKKIVQNTTADIREKLMDHIQRLPISYFENKHSGDIITRMTGDIKSTQDIYENWLLLLSVCFINGFGSLLFMFALDYRLAITGIFLGLINVWVSTIFIKQIRENMSESRKVSSEYTQKSSDVLYGAEVVKIFNLKDVMTEESDSILKRLLKIDMQRAVISLKPVSIDLFVSFLNFAGIFILGSVFVANHQMKPGTLMASVQFINGVFWMFSAFGSYLLSLQSNLASSDRIFEILDTPEEKYFPDIKSINITKSSDQNYIEFRNVSFAYNKDKPIIKDLNLSIRKHETVAIVGSSGGGKSTVMKLLMHFYTVNEGNVFIQGKDIADYSLNELRSIISYVPQNNYLFQGTIADNIQKGKPGCDFKEIENAARSAYAHDFITKFPNGYDTEVGERGTQMSGGERQRICIAMALLKNSPILLLDEATASLDSESEKQVQAALNKLMAGRTTIVVAHRLSTIEKADRILVLEDGVITEEGNHKTLLQKNGRYAYLYNLQYEKKNISDSDIPVIVD